MVGLILLRQLLRTLHPVLIQQYLRLLCDFFLICLCLFHFHLSGSLMRSISCCIYSLFSFHFIAVVCSAIPRAHLSIRRCGQYSGINRTDCWYILSLCWWPFSLFLQPFWLSCCPNALANYGCTVFNNGVQWLWPAHSNESCLPSACGEEVSITS